MGRDSCVCAGDKKADSRGDVSWGKIEVHKEFTTIGRAVCAYQPPPPPPPPPPPEKPPPPPPDDEPGGVTDELMAEPRSLERPDVVEPISKLFHVPLYQAG